MNNNALITVVLCLLVFVVGFILGRVTYSDPMVNATAENIEDTFTATEEGTAANANNSDNTDASQADQVQGGATVPASSMTDGQRQLIQALGLDPDSITITPEMVACAEAKLGVARVEEIKGGATPSFGEGASLVACYR